MFLHRTDFNQQYPAAHKLHHMYMDKQLQIWGGIHTPHLRDCRVSMNGHQATKQWFMLTF